MGMKRIQKYVFAAGKVSVLCLAALCALVFASCKSSPRTVEGRTVIADVDPIETASVTIQLLNFLGTAVEPTVLTVSFAPRTDEALLQFKMGGNTYYLYMPQNVRALVRDAAVRYNEDFAALNLDRELSQRKSEKIYGEAEGSYMRWGLGRLAMNGEGYPKIGVGYRFEGKSPYFVITVYSAENPGYKSNWSNIEKSIKYAIYMNKAQSLALADALREENLMKALDTLPVVPYADPATYEDDYAGTGAAAEPEAEAEPEDSADAYGA